MAKVIDPEVRQGQKITLAGVAVNALLIVIKVIGGILGDSQALIADAVHSFSDFFTDGVVLFGLKYGRAAPDEDHPFGHGRIETVAAAVVGLSLLAAGFFIGYESITQIYRPVVHHPGVMAICAAALSILAKEALYRYTVIVGRRIKSASVMANAWHHRTDALSSVAVLVGVTGAYINPDWFILDAYAALIVAIFVLKVGVEVLWESIKEVTDTAPSKEVIDEIIACAGKVHGVKNLHDLKVRSSGGKLQMEVHVVVDALLTVKEGHKIAKDVEKCLMDEVNDTARIIVHIDPDREG